jgi:hypothetical protein
LGLAIFFARKEYRMSLDLFKTNGSSPPANPRKRSLIINRHGELNGPHLFYGGTERLWFSEQEWTYYRETPTGLVRLEGVTNTLKIVDKSSALVPWAVRKSLERAKKLLVEGGFIVGPDAAVAVHPLFIETLNKLLEDARKEEARLLYQASDTGHAAHSWCESFAKASLTNNERRQQELLAKLPEDKRAANCCVALITFLAEHEVKWIAAEKRVLSLELMCCGTLDADILISSCGNRACCAKPYTDRRVILDLKTSNGVYPTHLAQTAFYQKAHEEEFPEIRYDGRVILRLGKDDAAEFEPWFAFGRELYEKDLAFFEHALALKHSLAETEAWMDIVKNSRKEAAALGRQAEKSAAQKKQCRGFKRYKGVRKPSCNDGHPCKACLALWEARHAA